MCKRISVKDASEILGLHQQSIRLGLQRKELPIGSAIKTSETRWTYHISPKLLKEYIGEEG